MVQEGEAEAFWHLVLQLALLGTHLLDVEGILVVVVFQGGEIKVDVLFAPMIQGIFLDGKLGESSSFLVAHGLSTDMIDTAEVIHEIQGEIEELEESPESLRGFRARELRGLDSLRHFFFYEDDVCQEFIEVIFRHTVLYQKVFQFGEEEAQLS